MQWPSHIMRVGCRFNFNGRVTIRVLMVNNCYFYSRIIRLVSFRERASRFLSRLWLYSHCLRKVIFPCIYRWKLKGGKQRKEKGSRHYLNNEWKSETVLFSFHFRNSPMKIKVQIHTRRGVNMISFSCQKLRPCHHGAIVSRKLFYYLRGTLRITVFLLKI